MSEFVELTLITKPGCHLCDDARAVVQPIVEEFAAPGGMNVVLNEVNMLENAELTARYSEEIPVLLINGKVHNYWRIDPDRLRSTLHSFSEASH